MFADKVILVIWVVFVIAMQLWLFIQTPPKEFIKKYPKPQLFRAIISGTNNWKTSVAPADIEMIERYRKKLICYIFILIVSTSLICAYFYSKYLHLAHGIS